MNNKDNVITHVTSGRAQRAQQHKDTDRKTQGHKNTKIQGYKDTRTQGHKDTMTQ